VCACVLVYEYCPSDSCSWYLVLGSVVIAFLCFGFSQRVNKFHIMTFITDP